MKLFKAYVLAALLIIALVFVLVTVSFYGISDPDSRGMVIAFDSLWVLCAALAAAALTQLLLRFERGEAAQRIWSLILLGALLRLAGDISWFVYEAVKNAEVPYPSVADYFWLASYIPFFIAMVALITGYRRLGLGFRKWSLAAVIPLSLAILAIVTWKVVTPIFSDAEAALVDKIVNPIYIYLDFFIFVPALLVTLAFSKGVQGRPWQLISYSFMLFAVYDTVYAYLSWNGLYSSGSHLDILWASAYLLLAVAAAYQYSLMQRA